MDLSQQQKNIIIELIKDKFHMNKENIQYIYKKRDLFF